MGKLSKDWYNAHRELSKTAFEQNKASILEALKKIGVHFVTVKYSGSGDSGNGLQVSFTSGGTLIEEPVASIETGYLNYDLEPVILKKWMTLGDALRDYCEDAISRSGHLGYENGLGGGGTLSIDVDQQRVTLEHYDVIEEHDESTHEL